MGLEAIEVERKVLDESRRFRACLPELLADHPGKWVVFHEGRVVSLHDTEEEAYVAGLARPGLGSGHVVAEVREPEDAFVGAFSNRT